jgi:hypothetical protein
MARIVYFFERKNDLLVAELERAGHTVVEALNLDEAFHLIEAKQVDIALISPEANARGNPLHHAGIEAIDVTPKTTAQEVIVEIAERLPGSKARVQ